MWDFNLKDIGRTLENLQDLNNIKPTLENLKDPVQDSIKRPVEVIEQIGENINDFFEPSLEQKKDVRNTTKPPEYSGRSPEDKISFLTEVIEQAVKTQQQQFNMLSKAVSQLTDRQNEISFLREVIEQAVKTQQQQFNMLSKAVSQLTDRQNEISPLREVIEQAVKTQQQQFNMLSKAVSQLTDRQNEISPLREVIEQAVKTQQQQFNMLSKVVSQLTDRQEEMQIKTKKNDFINKIILSLIMGSIVIGTLPFVGQTIASNFLVQSKNTRETSK